MAEWRPERPERPEPTGRDATWSDGARPDGGRPALLLREDGDAAGPAHPGHPAYPGHPAHPDPRARRRSWRARTTPGVRIVSALAVLAVAIAATAGIGTALTPSYGGLAPWRGAAIADLRESPTAAGWRTDLARDVLPGVPKRCAEFDASSATDPLVVITADSPPLGSSAQCSALTSAQVSSTVALLDPATGEILWRNDLRYRFPSAGSLSVQQTWLLPGAKSVLVEFSLDGRFSLAALSTRDGRVVSWAQVADGSIGSGPRVVGSLVLYGASTGREGTDIWTLADIADLGSPIWSATLPDGRPPVLVRTGLYAVVQGSSVRVDGTTGRVSRLGDGSVRLDATLQDPDLLFTSQTLASGTVVSAWGADGKRLWSRGGLGDPVGLSRDCVLVTLPGTSTLRCLDRDTGRSRWSYDLPSQGYPVGMIGQTTDDVAVFRSFGNHSELRVLSGSTGRAKYTLDLLPTTAVAAVSRTTGYLVSSSLSGSPVGLIAFDTESGRVLWQRNALDDGDTRIWGGRLIALSPTGVASELVDPPGRVLGADGPRGD